MEAAIAEEQKGGRHDRDITITVHTSRGSGSQTFPATTKIEDVINAIVVAFGFNPGDGFQLALVLNPGEPLDPNRPIVSYHLTDGDEVVLTAVGTGV